MKSTGRRSSAAICRNILITTQLSDAFYTSTVALKLKFHDATVKAAIAYIFLPTISYKGTL